MAGLVAVGVAWFVLSLFQPFKGEGEARVRVVVPRGSSLEQIAELLERRDVVSSSTFFQLRARLAGRSDDLKPGPYTLRRDMSFAAALDALEAGPPPDLVVLTIPEGLSRAEIAEVVGHDLSGSYAAASRRSRLLDPRDYRATGAESLEGFLFPATYELRRGQPVRRLVERQLMAFKDRFSTVRLKYARSKNLTPYDVLVIASMVEREAQVPRERRLIASVIYNRLRQGIRLDIDATTRYAVGNWSEPLKVSELQSRSPYNTRVHAGLPPGPIGNPGLDSIEAAAHPARTGYLFYVVKPGTCGRHNFAETDAEFQRYVDEYERAREQAGGRSPTKC
ncbi:MAG TPA: endolytic transglycosylase MltG [Thermoleophilaceae bacterium]|nr:endolytic transglycosylase MltG [Thermoleophilaceae bacterium]